MAEDQLINLQVIQSQIETMGLSDKTSFTTDGQAAIDCVQKILDASNQDDEQPISLMLLDFQMPKKNGI